MAFFRLCGSSRVSVVLLALLLIQILAGTLGQAAWGAAAVQTTLYSQVFYGIGGVPVPGLPFWLGLTAVNLFLGAWFNLPRTWTSAGLWVSHSALILFCLAGFGFAFVQEDLVLGLPVGSSADRAYVKASPANETRPLGFTLTVDSFQVPTYAGSNEPEDYVSQVRVQAPGIDQRGEIRMNQPLRFQGLTIYQSSLQTVEGQVAPVFKITPNAWGLLPYALSLLLFAGLGLHLALRDNKGAKRA